MKLKEAYALRAQMEATFAKAAPSMTVDEIIQNRVLCRPWAAGSHLVGETYTAMGQIWECFQAYNNAIYPDIAPGQAAWYTFNRPYHGTSPETAMPWVAPTGAHDIYNHGEYMVWTDGMIYKNLLATNFGPVEYPGAWEVAG